MPEASSFKNKKISWKIKIVEPELRKYKKKFSVFSKKHWGVEHESEKNVRKSFFATHTFVVTALVDNNLVGMLNVSIRDMVFCSQSISFGAIGGVVTHTKYQHLWIALSLIKYSIKELIRRGIDVSILCTDIEKFGLLYTKAGFKPIGRPYYFVNKDGKKVKEKGGMIASCKSPKKLNLILKDKSRLFIGISNF